MSPGLAIAGLLVGFLIGLTGVGSGALMAPVLLLLGVSPAVVVGSDLGFGLVTRIAGATVHVRRSTVSWPWVRRLALGSIPGAVLGSIAVVRLAMQPGELQRVVGVVLVASATAAIGAELVRRRSPARAVWLRDPSPPTVVIIGFALGLIIGATSVGSGSLVDMALVLFSTLGGARLVGTGLVHAVLLSAVASVAHWSIGTLDLQLVGALLIGSLPGVLAGSWAADRVPSRSLRWGVTALVLLSGITTLTAHT